jgi:hypothetical protein
MQKRLQLIKLQAFCVFEELEFLHLSDPDGTRTRLVMSFGRDEMTAHNNDKKQKSPQRGFKR